MANPFLSQPRTSENTQLREYNTDDKSPSPHYYIAATHEIRPGNTRPSSLVSSPYVPSSTKSFTIHQHEIQQTTPKSFTESPAIIRLNSYENERHKQSSLTRSKVEQEILSSYTPSRNLTPVIDDWSSKHLTKSTSTFDQGVSGRRLSKQFDETHDSIQTLIRQKDEIIEGLRSDSKMHIRLIQQLSDDLEISKRKEVSDQFLYQLKESTRECDQLREQLRQSVQEIQYLQGRIVEVENTTKSESREAKTVIEEHLKTQSIFESRIHYLETELQSCTMRLQASLQVNKQDRITISQMQTLLQRESNFDIQPHPPYPPHTKPAEKPQVMSISTQTDVYDELSQILPENGRFDSARVAEQTFPHQENLEAIEKAVTKGPLSSEQQLREHDESCSIEDLIRARLVAITQNHELNQKIGLLKSENESLGQQNADLKLQLEESLKTNADLIFECEKSKQYCRDLELKCSAIVQLESDCGELLTQVSAYEDIIRKRNVDIQRFHQICNQLNQENESLSEKLRQTTERLIPDGLSREDLREIMMRERVVLDQSQAIQIVCKKMRECGLELHRLHQHLRDSLQKRTDHVDLLLFDDSNDPLADILSGELLDPAKIFSEVSEEIVNVKSAIAECYAHRLGNECVTQ
eukprot:TRINITY_DN5606_c0_g1_i5.p1 TRINITY_DN5606_c0_g1~~TRINITY_DN5606_c0_g1_i5.p1  ORF type:complete len:637 (-),score=126.04 TRINITY_DN5606_c0_g1_i5:436-2346(-)